MRRCCRAQNSAGFSSWTMISSRCLSPTCGQTFPVKATVKTPNTGLSAVLRDLTGTTWCLRASDLTDTHESSSSSVAGRWSCLSCCCRWWKGSYDACCQLLTNVTTENKGDPCWRGTQEEVDGAVIGVIYQRPPSDPDIQRKLPRDLKTQT